METEITPAAPNTNGHADGYRRLGELEKQHAELVGQLRAAHERIEELEEKLTPEGFVKFLQNAQYAALNKALEDPTKREQFIKQYLAAQQGQQPG